MVAAFDTNGFLPAGIHEATWEEVVFRFGFTPRRQLMLSRLHEALTHFSEAGCAWALLAGSFVTSKANPGDLDVAWDLDSVDIELVHPMFLDPAGRNDVFVIFAGDYFPAQFIEAESGVTFAEFFQRTKDGRPVGIVKIDLSTLETGP